MTLTPSSEAISEMDFSTSLYALDVVDQEQLPTQHKYSTNSRVAAIKTLILDSLFQVKKY